MSESYVTAVHIVRVLFAVYLMPCSISTIFLVQCPIVFVLYFGAISCSISIIFLAQCPVVAGRCKAVHLSPLSHHLATAF